MASLQQRKNGYWYVRYRDENGVERTEAAHTKNKTEAKKLKNLRQVEEDQRALDRKTDRKTFEQAWVPFENHLLLNRKEATHNFYKTAFNKYYLPVWRKRYVDDVSALDIEALYGTLRGKLTPGHIRSLRISLSGFYHYCVDHNFCRTNPVKAVGVPVASPPDIKTINLEQATLLMKELAPDFRLAFALSYFASLRIGEVKGLQWQDYSTSNQTLNIQRSVYKYGTRAKAETGKPFQIPKSRGSVREIEIPDILRDMLNEWKKGQYTRRNNYDLIIPNKFGEVLDEDDYRAAVKAAATIAGPKVKGSEPMPASVGPHLARHGFARLFLSSGGNIRDLARTMGHGDNVKTTFKYLRWQSSAGNTPKALILTANVGTKLGTDPKELLNGLLSDL
jgi:integrase